MDHPFKKILLATEHTEFDAGSERVALEMAKRCGLPLAVVVPVLTNPEFEIQAHRLVDRMEHEIAARIDDLREVAKGMGVTIHVQARRGESPADEIIREAEAIGADLVVIRRRGTRSFLAKLLLGEMVSQVVGASPCSVLMVPRAAHMWSRGILAAVGGEDDRVAAVAAAVASQCGLPLHVLSVAQSEGSRHEAEMIVSRNAGIAAGLGAEVHGTVRIGRPCDEILAVPEADLVVVGMGNVRPGGTTRNVVEQSEKPVLAVHG